MVLKAKEGYVYYNGVASGKEIHLCNTDSPKNWREITEKELKETEEAKKQETKN